MTVIQGKGVSGGFAEGPLYHYRRRKSVIPRFQAENPQKEVERFLKARGEAARQLQDLAAKTRSGEGGAFAAVFEAYELMAEDPDFEAAIRSAILTTGQNAEAAVADTAARFAGRFAAMEDPGLQVKSADVRNVAARILSSLNGDGPVPLTLPGPVILMADDLAPGEIAQLPRDLLLGMVTEGGSSMSHTAILARTMGIPAVFGAGRQLKPEYDGKQAILDGVRGSLIVEPDAADREVLQQHRKEAEIRQEELAGLKDLPSVTKDGRAVRISCNIGSPADLEGVRQSGAEGIGLFRSEGLFPDHGAPPGEEAQFGAFREVLCGMDGREVVIRTLDAGADKQMDYLKLPKEENPALGTRGLRFCLKNPELFRTQLRALYRSSVFGRLTILFPMVASLWELREAKRFCAQVRDELKREGIPFDEGTKLGAMIETPAAALISDALAAEADYLSIGTNDLMQYTLAADRTNAGMERYLDPHHAAVLKLIEMTCANARRAGIRTGVCGELAADPGLTSFFLLAGADELSVSVQKVLSLRRRVRALDLSQTPSVS